MPAASFGQWIKRRRKELDLTQEELALQVGCSLVLIQKIEAGERRPSKQIAVLLADQLAIPAGERADFIHFAREINVSIPAAHPAPWRALRHRFTNLPAQTTPLFGRDNAVEVIRQRILGEQIRLLTLVGPPGIGKTRLGIEAAAQMAGEFEDGVYLIALAAIRDPGLVTGLLAQTFEIKEAAGQPLLERVKKYLADKRLLLLLDNMEQVVAAAPLIAELLAACPWLQVLATSRVSLHLRAERQFPVATLGLAPLKPLPEAKALLEYPAIALFVDRLQAADPDFRLTEENAGAAAEICARLDGLPLAIELIAAQAIQMPLPALLARLGSRLALLSGGPGDLPARHQTLRNAIQWSYDLLSAGEKTLLARLAVFNGGFTRQAADAVCGEDVSAGVAALAERSLLFPSQVEAGSPRYGMLETIREYALERLQESGEMETICRRHAACYLDLAEGSDLQQAAWLGRLEQEHDNLRAMLRWSIDQGEAELALRTGGALWRFWQMRGHLSEGVAWLKAALEIPCELSNPALTRARARALLGTGWLLRDFGDFTRTKFYFEQSLALYRQVDDGSGLAYATYSVGYANFMTGSSQEGIGGIEASLDLYRRLEDKEGITLALFMLGRIAVGQGDMRKGRAFLEECLAINQERGAAFAIARTLGSLGEAALYQGDYENAAAYLEESQARLDQLGERQLITWLLTKRGELAWHLGRLDEAQAFLEKSRELARQNGYKWNEAYNLTYLGLVALARGDDQDAQTLCEDSLASFKEQESEGDIAQTAKDLARVLIHRGEVARAAGLYEDCLRVFRKRAYQLDTAECLEGLATVRNELGDPCAAARLFGAAQALREALGAPLALVLRGSYDSAVRSARARLGEEAFDAEWSRGRALPLEQILDSL